MESTKEFRKRAASQVFQVESPDDDQIGAIKGATMILYFGGAMSIYSHATSLRDELPNKQHRARFLDLPEIVSAKAAIKALKASMTKDELQSVQAKMEAFKGKQPTGKRMRNRKNLRLAEIHQMAERGMRRELIGRAESDGYEVLFQLHDGIICRKT